MEGRSKKRRRGREGRAKEIQKREKEREKREHKRRGMFTILKKASIVSSVEYICIESCMKRQSTED